MEPRTDRRAAPRTPAKILVLIEGRDYLGRPVREETHTLLVNDSGALVPLAAEFLLEDRASVTNQATGERVPCRIAWRSNEAISGRWIYGIALLEARKDFWRTEK